MKNESYLAGPWHIGDHGTDEDGFETVQIEAIDGDGDECVVAILPTNGKIGDEDSATARLVAASPDMLEALVRAESFIRQFADWADKQGQDSSNFDWRAFMCLRSNGWTDAAFCREAIAKALGQDVAAAA